MKKVVNILLFACMMHSASAQESTWTNIERNDFLASCVNAANEGMSRDSAKFYCYCMLGKMEKKFPDPEKVVGVTEELESPEWIKIMQSCIGQNWSNEYRDGFLASCVEQAKVNLGEDDARFYCECMMFKLEQLYPNSADADNISSEIMQSPAMKKLVQSCLKPKQ